MAFDLLFFRCQQNQPLRQLGGPGTVVEIDESLLYKRKYNRGRLLLNQREHVWVFGMVQRPPAPPPPPPGQPPPPQPRQPRHIILEIVDRRNAATLLPLIQQHILPGTTIMSDLWAAYGGIANLPQGYQHFGVNHQVV